jgi:thiamine pyrophosphokinase
MNKSKNIYLLLNGPWDADLDWPPLQSGTLVMCADGGVKHAIKLDWPVNLWAGDLDSATEEMLASILKRKGFRRLTYPQNKDQTDFELLLKLALDSLLSPGEILVFCGLGRRWDMTLANILLPFAKKFINLWLGSKIIFLNGVNKIYCLQGPDTLQMPPDTAFSLLAAHDNDPLVTIFGDVLYPLEKGSLTRGLTRGLSNGSGPEGGGIILNSGSLIVTMSPQKDSEQI